MKSPKKIQTQLTIEQKKWLNKLNFQINKLSKNLDFRIDDLVRPMMTSRTQLFSSVKEMTGLSPHQYVQQFRLMKANQLIKSNQYNSIYDIVYEVGFKKYEDFQQLYIDMYNISPKIIFEQFWGNRLKVLILKKLSSTNYTVEDLLYDMSIDRKLLYKRTKRVTGLSPGRYIRKLRLEKAKHLIENGSHKTLREVAESVGFQRTDYFSNLYEAHYNYRPLEYLKNNS